MSQIEKLVDAASGLTEPVNTMVTPIAKSIENVTDSPTKVVGKSLSDLFELVFGNFLEHANTKSKFKYQKKYEAFEQKSLEKIESIPPEKVVEPQLSIIGPTLEVAKYYVESEELSEMFSNLIASSMNIDKLDEVHPSYVDIIKQLSPLDANNISFLANSGQLPICDFRVELEKGKGHRVLEQDIFLELPEYPTNLQSISIRNLIRLGLIKRPEDAYLTNENLYKKYEEHSLFKLYQRDLEVTKEKGNIDKAAKIILKKGYIELTTFGKSFVNTVVKS